MLPSMAGRDIRDAPQQLAIQFEGSLLLQNGEEGADLTFTDSYRAFNPAAPGMTYVHSPYKHGGQQKMYWHSDINEKDRVDFIYHDDQAFSANFELISSRVAGGGDKFSHGNKEKKPVIDETDESNIVNETIKPIVDPEWDELYPSDHYAVSNRYMVSGDGKEFAVFMMNILNEGCIVEDGVNRIAKTLLKGLGEEATAAGMETLPAIVTLAEVRDVPHGGTEDYFLGLMNLGNRMDKRAGSRRGTMLFEMLRSNAPVGHIEPFMEYLCKKLNGMDPLHEYSTNKYLHPFTGFFSQGHRDVDVGVLVRVPRQDKSLNIAVDLRKPATAVVEMSNDEGSALAVPLKVSTDDGKLDMSLIVVAMHANYKSYYLNAITASLKAGKSEAEIATAVTENERTSSGAALTDTYPKNNSRFAQIQQVYRWAAEQRTRDKSIGFIVAGDLNVPSHLDYGRK